MSFALDVELEFCKWLELPLDIPSRGKGWTQAACPRIMPYTLTLVFGQGNRISSCPCQYLQQVSVIETAKESFLPDAEGSGAFLS